MTKPADLRGWSENSVSSMDSTRVAVLECRAISTIQDVYHRHWAAVKEGDVRCHHLFVCQNGWSTMKLTHCDCVRDQEYFVCQNGSSMMKQTAIIFGTLRFHPFIVLTAVVTWGFFFFFFTCLSIDYSITRGCLLTMKLRLSVLCFGFGDKFA